MERNIRLNWDILVKEAIKRRKERKISQRRLAAIAEVSQPTVLQKQDIQLSSTVKILDVLGLTDKQGTDFAEATSPDKIRFSSKDC